MKYLHIYAIHTTTVHGFGMQPTKGNSIKEAKERFKKRYPKKVIIDADKIEEDHKHYNHFKTQAI